MLMEELYGVIEEKLNIDQETFDKIISDESAKQEICGALLFCLENVPEMADIASATLQYIADTETNADGGPGSGNFGHKGVEGQVGGSAPADSKTAAKSSGKSVKDFLPEKSYTDTPEHKKLAKANSEASRKKQEAFSEKSKLEKELRKESEPYDLNEEDFENWTDEEFMAFAKGTKPRRPTERGKEIKKKIEDLEKVYEEQSAIESDTDAQLRILKQEASVSQMEEYCLRNQKDPEPKKAERDSYEGFTLETTGTSFGDEYLESGKGYIAEMSPKEYLERCAFEIFPNGTMESTLYGAMDEAQLQ